MKTPSSQIGAALIGIMFTLMPLGASLRAQTTIDMSVTGTPIDHEILGTNWDLYNIQNYPYPFNILPGTMGRGVAGGLYADTFNWENISGGVRHFATMAFLRDLRDTNSSGLITVNMRGTGTGTNSSNFQYTDTSAASLVTLAADWVRYTNFIVPNGPQNAGDQAILNKIDWTGSGEPKLPAPGEGALPKIKYWEIGNEPQIKVSGKWFSSSFLDQLQGAWSTSEYVNRYKAITAAMKAQDPTIKVGPGLLDAVTDTAKALLDSDATIDFWGYHPYDDIGKEYVANGNASQVNAMEADLRNVRVNQINNYNAQRQAFTNAGRNPDNVQFMATEWNAMNYAYDDPSMYQTLGFAESIFTFAQLNMKAAHYYGRAAYASGDPNDPTYPANLLYPMVKAWQKLDEHMGDTLVNSNIDDADNLRVYTTRDSKTGEVSIWVLNFDNDAAKLLNLALQGFAASDTATLSILSDGANTRLWSTNADWTTQTLTNFNAANFTLNVPSASIAMLLIHPVPEPSLLGLAAVGLLGLVIRRPARGM